MTIFRLIAVLCITGFASHAIAAADNCFPFDQQQGRISLPISIAGEETEAYLNTGTRTIALSTGLVEQLNLEIELLRPPAPRRGVAPPPIELVRNVAVTVFGQDLEMDQVDVFDQASPVARMSLMMFSQALVQIDYPQSQICFLLREAMNLRAVANINMRTATSGAPAIEVIINGDEELWLRLQTGLPGAISLDYGTAEDLGLVAEDRDEDASGLATSPLLEGVIESLQFGPYELGNLAVAYPPQAVGNSQRPRRRTDMRAVGGRRGVVTHGELGHEVLKHFVITIDFEQENMHIFAP